MKFQSAVLLSVCALSAFHDIQNRNCSPKNSNNLLFVNGFAPASISIRPDFRIVSQQSTPSASSTARFDAAINGAEPGTTTTVVENESFTIETVHRAPNQPGPLHRLTFHSIPGQDSTAAPLVLETGKIGRQAAGAIEMTRGDTTLYATAARDFAPKDGIDFLPLSVEHSERFSSAGLTSGSYNKRDGRPAEHEILTCRLIDRPLRPLVNKGWRHETQLLSWVLSYDGERSCDPLAMTASSTALYISDVPLTKPVAAVNVGYVDETFIINPTNKQMETSRLALTVSGTKDGIMMIEGAADFLPEAIMIEAVQFGHEAIKAMCDGIEEFGKLVGKEKWMDTIIPPVEGLQERMNELMTEKMDQFYLSSAKKGKQERGLAQHEMSEYAVATMLEEYPEEESAIKAALKDLFCRRMFVLGKEHGLRCDGRKLDEIRPLDMEAGFLPSVHGSALFTRGETQTIATATLGDSGMRQKIDRLDGTDKKRFYLQYTFPPSCVGETGRVGMPGRREVGHGNLAERALVASLPTEEEFPYTIRVESLVTESNGSSSMASVCGGSLALMDAGVPVRPVAGIAMGLLLGDRGEVSDDNAIVLTDILGTEDALGTMDFKVAGDRDGISTFQLDIKCEGLTVQTMERALEQARQGRLRLLDAMEKTLEGPREELPATVPKMQGFDIPQDSIGKVIGPGGKQIRAIIEDFELANMDVGEEGRIQLSGFSTEKMKEAEEFIKKLIEGGGRGGGGRGGGGRDRPQYAGPEPEVGKIYNGKIMGTHNFGVFVEILPGAEDGSTPGLEGLCHVSELAREHVRNCEGFIRAMNTETLEVKFLGKNDKGKYQLSRKAALEEKHGGGSKPDEPKTPPPAMSKDEIDVIAQAIEGVSD